MTKQVHLVAHFPADTVVPPPRERGVFLTDHERSTLREHLGLGPLKAAS